MKQTEDGRSYEDSGHDQGHVAGEVVEQEIQHVFNRYSKQISKTAIKYTYIWCLLVFGLPFAEHVNIQTLRARGKL